MPTVTVLDYGFGNVRSAVRALEHVGAEVTLTADRAVAENADGLVVPGVGAFAACMEGLRDVRGDQMVGRRLAGGRSVLGICVGMQVMFERGVEHGEEASGLDEWPGTVELLQTSRIPNMGWAPVEAASGSTLFEGIEDERFYFVHSYGVRDFPLGGQRGHGPTGGSLGDVVSGRRSGRRRPLCRGGGERAAVCHAVPP